MFAYFEILAWKEHLIAVLFQSFGNMASSPNPPPPPSSSLLIILPSPPLMLVCILAIPSVTGLEQFYLLLYCRENVNGSILEFCTSSILKTPDEFQNPLLICPLCTIIKIIFIWWYILLFLSKVIGKNWHVFISKIFLENHMFSFLL